MKYVQKMTLGALALCLTLALSGCIGQSLSLSPSALSVDGQLSLTNKDGKAVTLSGKVDLPGSISLEEGLGSTDLTLNLGNESVVDLNIGMSIDDIAIGAQNSDGLVTKAKNGDQSLDLAIKRTGLRHESGSYQTSRGCSIVVGYDTVCRTESTGTVCRGEGRERVCREGGSREVCERVARTESGSQSVEVSSTTTYIDYAISLSQGTSTGSMTATSSDTQSSSYALEACHY